MLFVKKLTYSPFSENTYLLYNEEKLCWIIDPGCYEQAEKEDLKNQIEKEGLTPVKLVNTHCHVDHIFGNAFVYRQYGLLPEVPEKDLFLLEGAPNHAKVFGLDGVEPSPTPKIYLGEGQKLSLGSDEIELIEVAGHTPGHLTLYAKKEQFVISGDVLFSGSIGRTDLPGGDHESLLENIKNKMYLLEDDTVVYSGHGPETSIGEEKRSNPFVRA